MSDSDRDSPARRLTPSAYLTSRPARNPVSRPRSLYLSMPDGCRLAVDVYLPPESPDRVPAIHRQEVLIGQGKQAKVLRKTELQRLHTRHPERDRVICTRFCTSSSERT
jgi:predicted acyl esterase